MQKLSYCVSNNTKSQQILVIPPKIRAPWNCPIGSPHCVCMMTWCDSLNELFHQHFDLITLLLVAKVLFPKCAVFFGISFSHSTDVGIYRGL